jgi:alkylation response protein AidB-like acyl-CoA dehydrogenase
MSSDAEIEEPHQFRARVHAWLQANAPKKGDPDDFSAIHIVSATTAEEYEAREQRAMAVTQKWQRKLFDAGLAGRSWPIEYGGHGAPAWQDEIVSDEQSRYGVSTKMFAIALEMLPPVLFAHGTHGQRVEHLPRVVRGEESWCQLLSEPDAGSDLASVRTTATPVEGGWSVSGQKVWTSGAGSADYALLLARTSSDPTREGLSCMALDMSHPGVTVRPLRQMSGGYHFNEVFLDSVFVPEPALIGRLGGGWEVLRTMLASERAAIGSATSARSATQLVALARHLGRSDDPIVRQRVAQAVIRERLLDLLVSRVASGDQVPAGGPVTKLLYSEHARLTAATAAEILGPAAMVTDDPDAAPWVDRLLFAPGLRLGGGTDEIQRNAIAERGLALPREPRATPRDR